MGAGAIYNPAQQFVLVRLPTTAAVPDGQVMPAGDESHQKTCRPIHCLPCWFSQLLTKTAIWHTNTNATQHRTPLPHLRHPVETLI